MCLRDKFLSDFVKNFGTLFNASLSTAAPSNTTSMSGFWQQDHFILPIHNKRHLTIVFRNVSLTGRGGTIQTLGVALAWSMGMVTGMVSAAASAENLPKLCPGIQPPTARMAPSLAGSVDTRLSRHSDHQLGRRNPHHESREVHQLLARPDGRLSVIDDRPSSTKGSGRLPDIFVPRV